MQRWTLRHIAGVTLAETLVALLVIAVGVIGIASLYAEQAISNPEAQLHTRAAELAEQIAQRIAENAEGRLGYLGTIGVLCAPGTKTKTAHDAAAQEGACWEDAVERSLPSGLGSISRDTSTTPPTFVVAVSWSVPEGGTASYVLRIETPS